MTMSMWLLRSSMDSQQSSIVSLVSKTILMRPSVGLEKSHNLPLFKARQWNCGRISVIRKASRSLLISKRTLKELLPIHSQPTLPTIIEILSLALQPHHSNRRPIPSQPPLLSLSIPLHPTPSLPTPLRDLPTIVPL
jgi:hypothetical protein